jgi:hypothetical protein
MNKNKAILKRQQMCAIDHHIHKKLQSGNLNLMTGRSKRLLLIYLKHKKSQLQNSTLSQLVKFHLAKKLKLIKIKKCNLKIFTSLCLKNKNK